MPVLVTSNAVLVCSHLVEPFLSKWWLPSAVFWVPRLNPIWPLALLLTCSFTTALVTWHNWRRVLPEREVNDQRARNALIIGAGEGGRILARHLDEHKQLGFIVKGYVDPDHHHDARLLGKLEELGQIATKHFIDEVFIAMPWEKELIDTVLSEARKRRFSVRLVPQFATGFSGQANYEFIGDFASVALHKEPIPTVGLALKRAIDFVVAAVLLVLTGPIVLVIALAIKLDSRGPMLYRSWRVGKKGRKFMCYKFRTMVVNADELKGQLRYLNERTGLFFKIARDPRLTSIGPFLRRYSLDELPQLLSVLKGDMSLVGPRPPSLDEYGQYSLEHLHRLTVTPGLSGLWQVTARRDPSFETYLALDLEYIEKWSIWLDLKVILLTIPAILRGEGL